MSTMNPTHFFSRASHYLVLGASSNPSKFGYRVLQWYISHELPVIPINPNPDTSEISGLKTAADVKTAYESIKEQADVNVSLSLSFITPPHVTLSILDSIKQDSQLSKAVKGLWFQPGSYDTAVLEKVEELKDVESVLAYGDCILVQGDQMLREVKL